jgi:hypothetical protein
MSQKKGNFFEQHVDKMVLGVVGIICVWLSLVYVLPGAYSIEIGGNQLGPGEIDHYIRRQSATLEEKLEEPPEMRAYSSKFDGFAQKFVCSLNSIGDDAYFPLPGTEKETLELNRKYRLPEIGQVQDVASGLIRTVTYFPTEEVGLDNEYRNVKTKLADIDLVSVQGSFDAAGLYKNFQQSFAGRRVNSEWRDKTYAKPVFASIQLERQQQLSNGIWSGWEIVPRTKIDHLKSMLAIAQKVEDLDFDVKLKMIQFSDEDMAVQQNILQPAPYDFASKMNWYPPSFYSEYLQIKERQTKEAERKKLEERRKERKRKNDANRNTGAGRSRSGGRSGGRTNPRRGGRGGTELLGRGGYEFSSDQEAVRKKKEKQRTFQDLERDYKKIVFTEKTRLETIRDALVVWAHDDTVEPGQSYRYRLRVGVFNPIAGHDWFYNDQEHLKGQVILWSDYSEVTEPVAIEPMMHFFPVDVSPDKSSVKSEIAKFHFGKWRLREFDIRPGEMIGGVVEDEEGNSAQLAMGGYDSSGVFGGSRDDDENTTIDYTTGAVLVDLVQSSDLAGMNFSSRRYFDVLYTADDGTTIEHLPARKRYWPELLAKRYNTVKAAQLEEVIIVSRGQGQGGRKRLAPQQDTVDGRMIPGMTPEMMMEMMRRGSGGGFRRD